MRRFAGARTAAAIPQRVLGLSAVSQREVPPRRPRGALQVQAEECAGDGRQQGGPRQGG